MQLFPNFIAFSWSAIFYNNQPVISIKAMMAGVNNIVEAVQQQATH